MKKMNYASYGKTIMTAVFGFLSSVLGILFVPVMLMVACNIIDYITGLAAAGKHQREGINSYKSMQGIIKKVTMWLLVVVGVIIDQLLSYAVAVIGYQLPFTFLVACIVAIWIVCNELISILENMVDIGINLPAFLMPLVSNLKNSIDKITENKNDE